MTQIQTKIRTRRTRRTNLISPPNHALLALHLDVLLLLSVGQRPGHSQQEGARAEDPQRLAAKADRRLGERGQRRDGAGDAAPRGWGNDVLQGGDTFVECLVLNVNGGVGGDFGFYFISPGFFVSRGSHNGNYSSIDG